MNDDESLKLLEQLALATKKAIGDGLSSGSLHPEEEEYFRWRLNDFEYGGEGVVPSGAQGEYLIKKTWVMAIRKIVEDIKNSSQFTFTLEHLTKRFKNMESDYLEKLVEKFVSRVASDCFNEQCDESRTYQKQIKEKYQYSD